MLPFLFIPQYNRNASPLESPRFVWSLVSCNAMLIIFYYFNKLWLIPNILAKKKTWLYILCVLVYLAIYLFILYSIFINSHETQQFIAQMKQKGRDFKPRFFYIGPLSLFLFTLVISAGSTILSQWFSAEETREEISRQQLQTELSLLKSQVNPHFLFNTLNSIYSLSLTNNTDKTSDAVLKLSRIMRYTLEESKNDEVSLENEIEFIKSYIDLQKIRITDNVQINFAVKGETDNVVIAPLLFIPFIENAFKYGISTHHPSTITTQINITGNMLIFTCVNDVFPSSLQKHEGTGTGIQNTRRRLELLYPEKHSLTIESNSHLYKVQLELNFAV